MSIKKALLIELEREKENTKRVISRLPDNQFGYKPHEKSMTAGELASHIVELHNWVGFVLTKDVFDFHIDYKPSTLTTTEELLKVLDEGFEKIKRLLNKWKNRLFLKNGH